MVCAKNVQKAIVTLFNVQRVITMSVRIVNVSNVPLDVLPAVTPILAPNVLLVGTTVPKKVSNVLSATLLVQLVLMAPLPAPSAMPITTVMLKVSVRDALEKLKNSARLAKVATTKKLRPMIARCVVVKMKCARIVVTVIAQLLKMKLKPV
jgi:hypothetical protein